MMKSARGVRTSTAGDDAGVAETGSTTTRRRGRPALTSEESAEVRDGILQAFSEVFGELGYHKLTVAPVLERAHISRGTYYRYFHDLEEPMDLLLTRWTQQLADLLVPAITGPDSPPRKMAAAVDGYLEWGRRARPLLPSFYAGLHDATSPVARNRGTWIGVFVNLLRAQFPNEASRPDETAIHILVNSLEFSCYHHYLTHDPDDAAALAATREAMLKLTITLLLPPPAWTRALEEAVAVSGPGRAVQKPKAVKPPESVPARDGLRNQKP